ncbi:16S rRNA (uracil(1498)-N(3))-methyltransferase [Prevotella sp. PCHR]|uniref:Ribosomal RNA small subunit methyltransferase E n=1 Tax=Xylanibacter caecicola TaxID=2736294 RepID=A0ABX2B0R8_9BACT|nr:16S rRNA (uracil(1498)-N(3))-methyltransferase [Xylanibacter caecicola]NPE24632.1 16S rRNA (uracil(1498)-N(3))-methyltransferase [Xylanibacter caecicola]
MKEARYFFVPDAGQCTELPPDEAVHALRVLRLQSGDEMFLMDGAGSFYRAEVAETSGKRCAYVILEEMPQHRVWAGHIHVAMAPTKVMDRVEWFAEKATEVGVDELSFLNCRFSERRVMREDRIEKIVVSAAKQSRKPWMPVVNAMTAFADFIKEPRRGRKFIAHCYGEFERKDLFNELQNVERDADVTVLIGPEGDFSADEVRMAEDCGYESVTLGESRLRTETAALGAAMMMQLVKRNG